MASIRLSFTAAEIDTALGRGLLVVDTEASKNDLTTVLKSSGNGRIVLVKETNTFYLWSQGAWSSIGTLSGNNLATLDTTQTFTGEKDFVGGLYKNGRKVVTEEDISNFAERIIVTTEEEREIAPGVIVPVLTNSKVRSIFNDIVLGQLVIIENVDNNNFFTVSNIAENGGDIGEISIFLLYKELGVVKYVDNSEDDEAPATIIFKSFGAEIQPASRTVLGGVYMWTDEQGQVHITNTLPPPPAPFINIQTDGEVIMQGSFSAARTDSTLILE